MLETVFSPKILSENKPVDVIGLNKKVQAAYVWNLFRVSKKSILVITNSLYDANNLYKDLLVFSEKDVLLFPMDDFLAREAVAISPDLMAKRIETLNELCHNNKSKIIITNLMGYLRFLPSKDLWKKSNIKLKIGDIVKRQEIVKKLDMIGYQNESLVTKTGEYANRGYILDIFPYGYEKPVRIEFFDDEVDNIRLFDESTQLSTEKQDFADIMPFTEFINENNIEEIPKRQSLLPRVTKKIESLENYIGENITLFFDLDELKISYENIQKEVFEFMQTDVYKIEKYMHELNSLVPSNYVDVHLTNNYILSKNNICETYVSYEIDSFNSDFTKINKFLKDCLKKQMNIYIYFDDQNMENNFKEKTSEFYHNLNFIKGKVANSFIINDKVFLSSDDIYNKNKIINYKSKFKYGAKIKDINKLSIGDYIVHQNHGIGRYLGIVTLTVRGMKKDYLHLQYKGDDKLYIPVEKIELISKYSSKEDSSPRLNKLDGTQWAKQKASVKKRVKDIAKKLLEVSAKRKLSKGFSFYPDDEMQLMFENKFSYQETTDQIKVIREIKEDMENPYPMDRLLCGDVGYGKTEVAFRAIFKAIESGKQAIFLCPTTILSKQHYNNAIERFNGFGVNIEILNRFTSEKKKDEILKNLELGKIDLIIGTHRLLNKKIKYKDLGLLVIDEEQRFGVTHKERIKEYKQNIDILTLSATPIPRTLQMSLSKVRGLSLIETPPAYRYPVQTYVLRENDQVIKDAIYKELSRKGQIFFLYNNVSKIINEVSRIKKLVPEAKVTYIHGQMNKDQIEKTMESFVDKEYDILVCTTIIETGIDIENANTLIVLDADHFGLSQLYQIRGRIGRGKNIAYAYLMYHKNKELSDVAIKRLDAIKEFTELGNGYALAVRDLQIRGAGDILGSEQSGFIDTVGYDMYIKILNEEVEKLKGNINSDEENEDEETKKPFINVATHISDKYTDSEDLKIEIHKMINKIDSYQSFMKIKQELTDRFGNLEENIIIYMLEELFESNANKKGVFKVEETPRFVTVYFNTEISKKIDGADLLSNLFKINPSFEIKYINNILRISLPVRNLQKHFLYDLTKMLDVIE